MESPLWQTEFGDSPLVAAAIHNGHLLREELIPCAALTAAERLREEDPFTAQWTTIAPTRIVGLRSWFEVDLNRPRESAVYRVPADCWNLQAWRGPLAESLVARSLDGYDLFYRHLESLLAGLVARHGRIVVFDLHSYNHRRDGADGPPADPAGNPEANLGTGTLDRQRWASLIDCFLQHLRGAEVLGRPLDVRENVRFFGGHFPRWIHKHFPETVCTLSIEFKKTFMNEWTGEANPEHVAAIRDALRIAAGGVLAALSK